MPRSSKTAHAVRRSVLVRARPEEVFGAFREEARVQEWYFDDARVDFRVDGEISFEGPEGEVRASIREIDEEKRIVMEYGPPWWGVVTWDLHPTRTGTRVSLLHEGFEGKEEWLDRFAWGWEAFLKSLKAHCEGRPMK